MINLKLLKWNKCFSYGEGNSLNLAENTITQLVGLNGAGKSSIPLITEEVLFNKNSKGYKKAKISNRYLPPGYDISLSWEKDNDEYEITVHRKGSIKVSLSKNGVDISSHTAPGTFATVQEILGLDFKTFTQLVYQHPDSSLQFLRATDANRKKFFIDLLHLQDYIDLFELFKAAARDTNNEITKVSYKLSTVEKWLLDNKLSDTTILPRVNLEIDTEDDEKQAAELSTTLKNIHEKNRKIIQNNKYRELLKAVKLQEAERIKADKKIPYDHLQTEIGELNAAISAARREITKLEKLDDTCPTCSQPVDQSFIEKLLKEQQSIVTEKIKCKTLTQEEIDDIKRNNRDYARKIKTQEEWEKLYHSIDRELRSDIFDERTVKKDLETVQTRLKEARAKLKEVEQENERIAKRNTRIQVILEQTDKFQKELEEYQTLLDEQKELLSMLETLKKALSPNGLLAYKIENLVKELEELTNKYLAELSSGRFSIAFVVKNDKLNINLIDNGNEVDITELSSGELARVNTATLIAIRKLMNSISKSRIKVLFLDEVINVLDEEGREKLIEVLLNEKDLNTYIVSHGWAHPLLEKIEVVKENNISRLEK
jgi:DNA repair exonuclease SbcCD ATPase subunit